MEMKQFVENYVYHPKTGRFATYMIGMLDAIGMIVIDCGIDEVNSGNIVLGLGGIIASHHVGCTEGRDNQRKERELAKLEAEIAERGLKNN